MTTPEPETGVRLSVVIVSYNTLSLLRDALTSLDGADEVIVVDNASTDGSPEMVAREFPAVRLIANTKNRGFGAANNQGMDVARGGVVLLLNSDARAMPGALEALQAVFDDPDVVAAGGRLEHPDGSRQLSCANELTLWAVFCEQTLLEKVFPGSQLFSPYWLRPEGDEPVEVAQVMGACLAMRPVQRFDERFFLYCEDTELCHRLRAHGRIVHVPTARFRHELGASSAGTRWQAVARYNRGKELYFTIHQGRGAAAVCWMLNRMGALLRLLIWGLPCLLTLGLVGRLRRQAGLFASVLFAPVAGPSLPPDAR